MKRGETIELEIEKTVPGGAGLAHAPDGRVVFVRLGLPGSRVEAELGTVKRSFAEARRIRTVRPSPYALPARCPHVGTCGGCSFQELPYELQLTTKEGFVREALAGSAKLDVPVRTIVPSPETWHYRNKVEFSFGMDATVTPTIGYKVPGLFNRVFAVRTCPLFDERGDAILAATHDWIPRAGVPVYDGERHGGVLQYLVLRRSVASGELLAHLILRSNAPDETLWRVASSFASEVVPGVDHVVATINRTGITPQVGSRETRTLRGAGVLTEQLGGLAFRISPFSFFQTNTGAAEQLVAIVREAAGLTGSEQVLDLYGGTGTIGQVLSPLAREVLGIERDAAAVADANANATANSLTTYRAVAGDVHRVLAEQPALVSGADVIVVDPPRSGLDTRTIADVLRIAAPRIVSVSCNPATQARDLAILARAYSVDWVQPLDQFPHTPHCESVASLTRRDTTRATFHQS